MSFLIFQRREKGRLMISLSALLFAISVLVCILQLPIALRGGKAVFSCPVPFCVLLPALSGGHLLLREAVLDCTGHSAGRRPASLDREADQKVRNCFKNSAGRRDALSPQSGAGIQRWRRPNGLRHFCAPNGGTVSAAPALRSPVTAAISARPPRPARVPPWRRWASASPPEGTGPRSQPWARRAGSCA